MSFRDYMTKGPYSGMAEILDSQISSICAVEPIDDGVRFTTHCMYPSNGLVRVTVRGGNESVIVSDDGGALSEVASAGIQAPFSDRIIANQIAAQGLKFAKGHIFSPRMPLESAAVAILVVANASKEIAQWHYDHSRIRRDRDFKKLVAQFLEGRFLDRVKHDSFLIGASNKAHKFANIVTLTSGRRLIVDPVVNDASSINARVVANLDIKAANDDSIEQRIVFDDEEDWTPSDLNLLNVGAIAIPFSLSSEVIERIAAHG